MAAASSAGDVGASSKANDMSKSGMVPLISASSSSSSSTATTGAFFFR
jgi:hypothetical protein